LWTLSRHGRQRLRKKSAIPDPRKSTSRPSNFNQLGRAPGQISQGAITYQLRRLRLHGFVERQPNSFRYRVTAFGLRAALFFTRAYNRILRPALAAALLGIAAVPTPLKRALDNIDAQLTKWINHAQLAA
jgi:hypothetical protein